MPARRVPRYRREAFTLLERHRLVNLAVSFSLALRVALRSRGITREQTAGLWPRVLRRFLARPRDFFWPPAFDGAAP